MRWVHVSDLHFGDGDTVTEMQRRAACNALIEDARAIRAKRGAADLLFVTGDIAWSGKPEQYVQADAFLTQLCEAIGAPRERVFVVPGNHDVDRKAVVDASAELHKKLRRKRAQGDLDRVLVDKDKGALLTGKLKAYRSFAERWTPAAAAATPHYSHMLEFEGRRVEIHGLCSAILSLDDKDGPKTLELGLTQRERFHDVPDPRTPVLHVVLMHHPQRWLADGPALKGMLGQRAHLQFTGHVHTPSGGAVSALFGPYSLFIEAGAVHSRHDADRFTYSWGELTPNGGIRYWPRALVESSVQKYLPDTLAGDLDDQQARTLGPAVLPPPLQAWLAAVDLDSAPAAPESLAMVHLVRCLETNVGLADAGRACLGLKAPTTARALAQALVARARDAQGALADEICEKLFGEDTGVTARARLTAFKWLWAACGRFTISANVISSNNPAAPELGEAERRTREPDFVLRRVGNAADGGAVPLGKSCFFAPEGRKYLDATDFVRDLIQAWWDNHRVPNKRGVLSHPDKGVAMRNELASSRCHLYIVYREGDFSSDAMRKALEELGLGPDRCIAYGQDGPADTIFETLCNLVVDAERETQATNVHDSRR